SYMIIFLAGLISGAHSTGFGQWTANRPAHTRWRTRTTRNPTGIGSLPRPKRSMPCHVASCSVDATRRSHFHSRPARQVLAGFLFGLFHRASVVTSGNSDLSRRRALNRSMEPYRVKIVPYGPLTGNHGTQKAIGDGAVRLGGDQTGTVRRRLGSRA